jgi:ASC-1-like (ASCH) protein
VETSPSVIQKICANKGSIDVEGCLVLFPKYMLKLSSLGKEIFVTGDKIGDRKACSIIVEGALNRETIELCDVLVFNLEKKVWIAINVESSGELTIKRKGYDSYSYYIKLRDFDSYETDAKSLTNALTNYVRIYSSANLSIR